MLDIKFVRENPEKVKENIKKKFQDQKLPLVDEVIELDSKVRALKLEGDNLRSEKNTASANIGALMKEGKKEEAEQAKTRVKEINDKLAVLEKEEAELGAILKAKMMIIPNIIADDVPIGKDDSFNVEEQVFGEKKVPDFEVPYHADIMATFNGLDKDAAGRVSGNGFYYLMGDIARLHSAVLAYARDFMIDKGFTYCIPPFMIHSDAVDGVMSFAEKENMMYKIEGEDLYLIGTSEHSMIGRFIGEILKGINLKEDPIFTILSKAFANLKGSTKNFAQMSDKEQMALLNQLDNTLAGTLKVKYPKSSVALSDIISQLKYGTDNPKVRADALDLILNPSSIKSMTKERYDAAYKLAKSAVDSGIGYNTLNEKVYPAIADACRKVDVNKLREILPKIEKIQELKGIIEPAEIEKLLTKIEEIQGDNSVYL